jgi:hypothetical protein
LCPCRTCADEARSSKSGGSECNSQIHFILLIVDDPDWIAINRYQFSIDLKLFRRRAPQGAAQT